MRASIGSFPTWLSAVATADLWTFTLASGAVYRWTSWETSLNWYGYVWAGTTSPNTPMIQRRGVKLVAGLEVDNLDFTVMTGSSVLINGLPFPQAAMGKLFDGCDVLLERAYMAVPGSIAASAVLFRGTVSEVKPSHTEVQFSVKSFLERLNQPWPRNYWSPTCQRKLYSTGCGVSEAAYSRSYNIISGTNAYFNITQDYVNGYFQLGKCTFTSGPLAGVSMGIKDDWGGQIQLLGTLPMVAQGSVTLAPGCDKTYTTCRTKFSNLSHFKGCPFIPRPEMAR